MNVIDILYLYFLSNLETVYLIVTSGLEIDNFLLFNSNTSFLKFYTKIWKTWPVFRG